MKGTATFSDPLARNLLTGAGSFALPFTDVYSLGPASLDYGNTFYAALTTSIQGVFRGSLAVTYDYTPASGVPGAGDCGDGGLGDDRRYYSAGDSATRDSDGRVPESGRKPAEGCPRST